MRLHAFTRLNRASALWPPKATRSASCGEQAGEWAGMAYGVEDGCFHQVIPDSVGSGEEEEEVEGEVEQVREGLPF